MNRLQNGDQVFLDRGVVLLAVGRRIVKPVVLAEFIVAIILKAGVLGDLRANRDHLIENLVELFGLLHIPVGRRLPGALTQIAVGLGQKDPHPAHRVVFAVKSHRHRPGHRLVLLAKQCILGLQRHVGFAEQFHVAADLVKIHIIATVVQADFIGGRDHLAIQLVGQRLDGRLHRFDKRLVGLGPGGVVGLAGHADIENRLDLCDGGFQLRAVADERLDIGRGGERPLQQLLIQPGHDLLIG